MEKLRVIELFSGIGSQRQALKNLNIDHEVVAISEIDQFAIKSYNLIHGETFNLGDITKVKVEDIPQVDLLTYSFPCQDISIAGNGLGAEENSGTRSSLLWNVKIFIEAIKPKYLLMENVKNLIGKTHKPNFLKWLDYLESIGYSNHWEVLNAKDFNTPQNRERVFAVSILNNSNFSFPKGEHTSKTIEDILETNVDLKYFMDKPYIPREKNSQSDSGLIHTGNLEMKANEAIKRVYDPKGLCPTLTTMTGGHRQPKILIENKVRKLTPTECWRLMGFKDEQINIVKPVLSDAQLYKQAGNTICVGCLEAIFKNLLI